MTFLASWRLVFVVAPLLLLGAYLWAQRGRRAAAVRFSSVDLLASVAPRRPGWQRHVPAGVLLLGLVSVVLGFAEPANVVRTAKQRATVVLTLDTSGSMVATDVTPDRLAAAQQAARRFVQALPPGVQVGLVSFSTNASVLVAPTTDRATLLAAINGLQPGGGTATASAINLSLQAIRAVPVAKNDAKAPGTVVLMSDGSPTIGENGMSPSESTSNESANAKAAGVKINTIAFGTADGTVTIGGELIPVPADPDAMAQIASATGGRTFSAQSAGQLKSVYNEIGRAVGYDVHHRDVTAWFIGIGLVLLVLASAGALVWNQRLV
ncbi:MAG: VWA domain-containing protein [Acidimicrobiales bacterium]|nr:VWA domain-containing protein [Acidimicrobiales bacterium]